MSLIPTLPRVEKLGEIVINITSPLVLLLGNKYSMYKLFSFNLATQ